MKNNATGIFVKSIYNICLDGFVDLKDLKRCELQLKRLGSSI